MEKVVISVQYMDDVVQSMRLYGVTKFCGIHICNRGVCCFPLYIGC